MPRVTGNPIGTTASSGTLGRRIKKVKAAEKAARQDAAKLATTVTRQAATRTRPTAPPRPGRRAAGLGRNLIWRTTASGSNVFFDVARADGTVPYWSIQEIGTNQSATMKIGKDMSRRENLPAIGRPTKEFSRQFTRSVRSQVGRRIHVGLVWGDSGGRYHAPSASRLGMDQIQVAANLSGVVQRRGNAPGTYRAGIRITREIPGKRMVHQGAQAGFRQYRNEVLAAARRAFGGFSK